MTDLLHVLPDFPTSAYTHLLPSLEKHLITTSDLLTLDALDVAKRAQLPVLDLRRFVGHIVKALQVDLGIVKETPLNDEVLEQNGATNTKDLTPTKPLLERGKITLLDPTLDSALGGGILTGYVTEITGESGVGKTQFLLSLLLAAQLSPPSGLGRSSIYISTEASLSTKRLKQILDHHPMLSDLPIDERPKLENVRAVPCGDLEAQDHILEFQLPAAIDKFNVGLVVLDSVAANYRAEHGSVIPKDLADRAVRLAKLGHLLRHLAVTKNIAIVVANQVSDRLDTEVRSSQIPPSSFYSSSPMPSSPPGPPPSTPHSFVDPVLSLDHQQRFFTGWGDERVWTSNLKTPALGLGWTNQLACRIALKFDGSQTQAPVIVQGANGETVGGNSWTSRRSNRYLKVVFSPWAAGHDSENGVKYEITTGGIRSIHGQTAESNSNV